MYIVDPAMKDLCIPSRAFWVCDIRLPASWLIGAVLLFLVGCSEREPILRISEERTVPSSTKPVAAGADTMSRFSARDKTLEMPSADTLPQPPPVAHAPLRWTLPEGWVETPPRAMRVVTFTVPGGGECYVSQLSGDGGGLSANLNRWRSQMGLAPLDDAAIDALPRYTVLGSEIPLIEMTGTYTAMSGEAQPGSRFLGVAASAEGQSWFIRMTGPDEAVATQRDAFVAFCESLTLVEGAPAHEIGF